jgi:hypothetical protein|tara:strand:- start:3518 stop:3751 length:234 start_codon:yes stop_codon:yes gene_type:complete
MEKENPKQYFINDEVLSLVWIALHESGNTELAQVVANSMQAQGCQELTGTEDMSLIILFWKEFLENKGIAKITQEMH